MAGPSAEAWGELGEWRVERGREIILMLSLDCSVMMGMVENNGVLVNR